MSTDNIRRAVLLEAARLCEDRAKEWAAAVSARPAPTPTDFINTGRAREAAELSTIFDARSLLNTTSPSEAARGLTPQQRAVAFMHANAELLPVTVDVAQTLMWRLRDLIRGAVADAARAEPAHLKAVAGLVAATPPAAPEERFICSTSTASGPAEPVPLVPEDPAMVERTAVLRYLHADSDEWRREAKGGDGLDERYFQGGANALADAHRRISNGRHRAINAAARKQRGTVTVTLPTPANSTQQHSARCLLMQAELPGATFECDCPAWPASPAASRKGTL